MHQHPPDIIVTKQILYLSYILEWQVDDLSRCLDVNKRFKSCFNDLSLLLNVVRSACVSAHRHQRSYRTRRAGLTYNRRKGCNNNCRNSSLFNRSLHQYCRAVAGTSASGEDNRVNILFFKHLSDSRSCLTFEFFLVSAAAHESCMYRSAGSDKSFCS